MKCTINVLVFLISFINIYSQKAAANWMFGSNAALSFDTPDMEPVPVNGSSLISIEGSASISDDEGRLLFYTNGESVWNAKHLLMMNGEKISGHTSSTQSAIIVRHPVAAYLYYIFTIDPGTYDDKTGSFDYSIVDMSAEKGLGRVEAKNMQLIASPAEKITAVRHADGIGTWIITHSQSTREFYAVLLDASGTLGQPVITKIGSSLERPYPAGQMKVSPSGRKIAQAINTKDISLIEIYNFNNSNGTLNIARSINPGTKGAYGVEFSPNEKMLYFTGDEYRKVYQADISSENTQMINESLLVIEESNAAKGSLQLAPNGCIYVAVLDDTAKTGYLSAITQPNMAGKACEYKTKAVELAPGTFCRYGLPNFEQSVFKFFHSSEASSNSPVCEGKELVLNSIVTPAYRNFSYQWYKGDSIVSSEKNPHFDFSSGVNSGTYVVRVTNNINEEISYDTVEVLVNSKPVLKIKAGREFLCEGESLELKADGIYEKYKWSDGSSQSSIMVSKPGTYTLWVENENGCRDTAKFDLKVFEKASVSIKGITAICSGEPAVLTASPYNENFDYTWSDGSQSDTCRISQPGIYWLEVSLDGNCAFRDSIVVAEKEPEPFAIAGPSEICPGQELLLSGPPGYDKYEWSTGELQEKIAITKSGTYTLTVTDLYGCTDTRSMTVTDVFIPFEIMTKEVDLGQRQPGEKQKRIIILQNRSGVSFPATISLVNDDPSFSITAPETIDPGITNIEVDFDGQSYGQISDTVSISFALPCQMTYKVPLKAYIDASAMVYIPDRAAVPGTNAFPVQLLIRTEGIKLPVLANIKAKIRLDEKLFLPRKESFIIADSSYDGSRFLAIEKNVFIDSHESELARITGMVGLNPSGDYPVQIESFDLGIKNVEVTVTDGKISLENICADNLRLIELIKPVKTVLSPNPASSICELGISNAAQLPTDISIFSYTGEKVKQFFFTPGTEKETFSISLENLSAGAYTVVVRTAGRESRHSLVVGR